MWQETGFSKLLKEKRMQREITVRAMAEMAGVSAGYYSDIESGRRNPPDREILDRMLEVLSVTEKERRVFYDFAGDVRSEAPADLPEYINKNEVVRVALRMAKQVAKDNRDTARVWNKFIDILKTEEGGREND